MRHSCSAIVCVHSHDRWDDICRAITSLRGQNLACDEIIVVVDHNESLRQDLEERFPDITLLENSQKKGLSGARNTGVEAAKTEIVAFLDDDAAAESSWLRTALRWFDDPSVLGVGSLIEARWLAPTPKWFPDEFLWTVGCTYRGYANSGSEIRNVFGAAMIVRRDVLRQAGGFSHAVGRHGGWLPISCEETEFCLRAKSANPSGRFVYDEDSSVQHTVPPQRLTIKYFLLRCLAEGYSKSILKHLVDATAPLAIERDYVLKKLTRAAAREIRADLTRARPGGILRVLAMIAGVSAAAGGYGWHELARIFRMRTATSR